MKNDKKKTMQKKMHKISNNDKNVTKIKNQKFNNFKV